MSPTQTIVTEIQRASMKGVRRGHKNTKRLWTSRLKKSRISSAACLTLRLKLGSHTAFIAIALARLGYLYPQFQFSRNMSIIYVSGVTSEHEIAVKRDVFHTLYREKIYAETLPLRTALIEMVSKS
jgi:hypothetical protein